MQGDLVQWAQRGDHEAFDSLAGAAYDRLYALAYRILRDADRAQDAVQECLVHAWRNVVACGTSPASTPGSSASS